MDSSFTYSTFLLHKIFLPTLFTRTLILRLKQPSHPSKNIISLLEIKREDSEVEKKKKKKQEARGTFTDFFYTEKKIEKRFS